MWRPKEVKENVPRNGFVNYSPARQIALIKSWKIIEPEASNATIPRDLLLLKVSLNVNSLPERINRDKYYKSLALDVKKARTRSYSTLSGRFCYKTRPFIFFFACIRLIILSGESTNNI